MRNIGLVIAGLLAIFGQSLLYAEPGDLSRCVLNMSDYDNPDRVFAKVKTEGIALILHRATLGIDLVDGHYLERMTAAQDEDLMWGAYHFCRQDEDPILQANNFIRALLQAKDLAPVSPKKVLLVADVEYYAKNTKFMKPSNAAIFISRVHQLTGVYPGLYTGQNFLMEKLQSDKLDSETRKILSKTWLWIARYSRAFPEWPDNGVKTPWDDWSLWQYTGDGVLGSRILPNRVNTLGLGKAELNLWQGSRSELARFYDNSAWDYSLNNATLADLLHQSQKAVPGKKRVVSEKAAE